MLVGGSLGRCSPLGLRRVKYASLARKSWLPCLARVLEMPSYCCPNHSLLRSPKPYSSLRSGGTWRFRNQEEQQCCEPRAVVHEDWGAGPNHGRWKPQSWAGSSVFVDLAGRWVVGISLLTCVPGWWTMLSSGCANLAAS